MKKTLLSLVLLGACTVAHGQILNPGFEAMRPTSAGGPAYWGRFIGTPSPCTVQEGYDSVYFQTTDAHSGSYALELRNAHCDASMFAGSVFALQNDTNYFSGGGFPYTASPTAVSFFYKLFPTGGDAGYVTVELWDDVANTLVAEGEVELTMGSAIGYQPANVPLTYTGTTSPTRITVTVGIRNNTTSVHYGTRFLVDDFSDNSATGIGGPAGWASAAMLSPNPATSSIIPAEAGELTLLDATGRVALHIPVAAGGAVDVRALPRGLYAYRIVGNNGLERRGMLVLK